MFDESSKRHQFLFVDDDPSYLTMLTGMLKQFGKTNWSVRTATNHLQALEMLKEQSVDVIVLDTEMPVMDGIEFLRLLSRTHPNLRSVMFAPQMIEESRKASMELGAALYLEKPETTEGFQSVFAALDALATAGGQSGFRGVMQVGLQDVLQMECLGRKSSILTVTTGSKRGHIYICEGEIIHAETGPMQGEMALYGLLGLAGGEFSIHPFSEPPRRSISGQYEFLLMEAARMRDENSSPTTHTEHFDSNIPAFHAPMMDGIAPTEARGVLIEEAVLCSSAGEVLYQWKCDSIDQRLELFKKLEAEGLLISKGMASGRFNRVSMDVGNSRMLIQIQPTYKLLIRSALPGGPPHS